MQKLYKYKGRDCTIKQLAAIARMKDDTLLGRLKRGIKLEVAMNMPVNQTHTPSDTAATSEQCRVLREGFGWDNSDCY